jgi:hypothetical protein
MNMRKAYAATLSEEKAIYSESFLTGQDEQEEKARRKRRDFRPNGRLGQSGAVKRQS